LNTVFNGLFDVQFKLNGPFATDSCKARGDLTYYSLDVSG